MAATLFSMILFDLGGGGLRFTIIPDYRTVTIERNLQGESLSAPDMIVSGSETMNPAQQNTSKKCREWLEGFIKRETGDQYTLDSFSNISVSAAGLDKLWKEGKISWEIPSFREIFLICSCANYASAGDAKAHLLGSMLHSTIHGTGSKRILNFAVGTGVTLHGTKGDGTIRKHEEFKSFFPGSDGEGRDFYNWKKEWVDGDGGKTNVLAAWEALGGYYDGNLQGERERNEGRQITRWNNTLDYIQGQMHHYDWSEGEGADGRKYYFTGGVVEHWPGGSSVLKNALEKHKPEKMIEIGFVDSGTIGAFVNIFPGSTAEQIADVIKILESNARREGGKKKYRRRKTKKRKKTQKCRKTKGSRRHIKYKKTKRK